MSYSSPNLKPLLLAAIVFLLPACGDQDASGATASVQDGGGYEVMAMEKRILSLATEGSIPARKEGIVQAIEELEEYLPVSRSARRHHFKLLEMQADVVESREGLTFARPLREERRKAMVEALTKDQGDGNLRGHIAYEIFRDGDREGGWALLESGLELTDEDDENEKALLYFLASFPSLTFASGSREKQDATSRRFVAFLRKLKARREGRPESSLDESIELSLITWLIRIGQKEEATELLDQFEAKDPARSEVIDLRRRLR